jgi:hypothetical protein
MTRKEQVVTEQGAILPSDVEVLNSGPDPVHLGRSCSDPALLPGQRGKSTGAGITATGGRAVLSWEEAPGEGEGAAPEPPQEPQEAPRKGSRAGKGGEIPPRKPQTPPRKAQGGAPKASPTPPRKAAPKPPQGSRSGKGGRPRSGASPRRQ